MYTEREGSLLEDEPPHLYIMDQGKVINDSHEYQMPALCGCAMVRVIQKAAKEYQLRTGIIPEEQARRIIIPDQRKIAAQIMTEPIEHEYWPIIAPFVSPKDYEFYQTVGLRAYCLPEDIAKFLGTGATFKENMNIGDLKNFLTVERKPVCVLWNEKIPDRHGTKEGGHWSIAVAYNHSLDAFKMVDTSLAERHYDYKGRVVTYIPNEKYTYWRTKSSYFISAPYLGENLSDKAIVKGKERQYNGAMIVLDLAKIRLPLETPVLAA